VSISFFTFTRRPRVKTLFGLTIELRVTNPHVSKPLLIPAFGLQPVETYRIFVLRSFQPFYCLTSLWSSPFVV
jgi:hypothetical protein